MNYKNFLIFLMGGIGMGAHNGTAAAPSVTAMDPSAVSGVAAGIDMTGSATASSPTNPYAMAMDQSAMEDYTSYNKSSDNWKKDKKNKKEKEKETEDDDGDTAKKLVEANQENIATLEKSNAQSISDILDANRRLMEKLIGLLERYAPQPAATSVASTVPGSASTSAMTPVSAAVPPTALATPAAVGANVTPAAVTPPPVPVATAAATTPPPTPDEVNGARASGLTDDQIASKLVGAPYMMTQDQAKAYLAGIPKPAAAPAAAAPAAPAAAAAAATPAKA